MEIAGNKSKSPDLGLILSIVALIGTVVLFILFFTDKDEPIVEKQVQNMPVASSGSNSIVFVNSDVLLQEYELVKNMTAELESETKRKDAEFSAQQKAFESDAAYFQDQVQKQSISEQSAQVIYEQLMTKQQELYGMQEQYAAELQQKQFELNVVLLDSVRNYLERVNKIYKYDYILGFNTAGNIFLAKDTFDITSQVLEGLNNEYRLVNSTEN